MTDRRNTEISPPAQVFAGFSIMEWIVIAAAFAWAVLVGIVSFGGAGPAAVVEVILALMAGVVPALLVWVTMTTRRAARRLRDEAARLGVAVDALRQSLLAERQNKSGSVENSVEKRLNEIARAARQTETVLAMFTSTRDATAHAQPVPAQPSQPAPAPREEDQPALALGTSNEDMQPPLSNGDLIRALNFPETSEDEAGFAALRRALKDREARQLVQASQDILTLLSQDGIYMDDLHPDRARPEIWRRFARGDRGKAVAALGGIRDRSSLALTAGRMREDTIFRDAAHHFLRRFDRTLVAFEEGATDAEISEFADTRTARAFMILGRVTGTFD